MNMSRQDRIFLRSMMWIAIFVCIVVDLGTGGVTFDGVVAEASRRSRKDLED
jgi:hypothetical protein